MSLLTQTAAERRRLRTAWISERGRPIALFRKPDPVSDGAGSNITPNVPDTPLAPRVRVLTGLTMVGRGVNQMPERWFITQSGERQKVVYLLIGTYDDDIRRHDYWFNENNERLEVVFVHDDHSYQTKAEVVLVTGSV